MKILFCFKLPFFVLFLLIFICACVRHDVSSQQPSSIDNKSTLDANTRQGRGCVAGQLWAGLLCRRVGGVDKTGTLLLWPVSKWWFNPRVHPLSCPDLFLYTITLPAVSCDAPPTLSNTTLELASKVLLSSKKPALRAPLLNQAYV